MTVEITFDTDGPIPAGWTGTFGKTFEVDGGILKVPAGTEADGEYSGVMYSADTAFNDEYEVEWVLPPRTGNDVVFGALDMAPDGSVYFLRTEVGSDGTNGIYRRTAAGVVSQIRSMANNFPAGAVVKFKRTGVGLLEVYIDGTLARSFDDSANNNPDVLPKGKPGVVAYETLYDGNAAGLAAIKFHGNAAAAVPVPGLRIENRVSAGGAFIPNATHTFLVIIGSNAHEVSKAVTDGLCVITSDDLPNGVDLPAIDQKVFVSVPDGNPTGDDPANMLTVVDINDPATRS